MFSCFALFPYIFSKQQMSLQSRLEAFELSSALDLSAMGIRVLPPLASVPLVDVLILGMSQPPRGASVALFRGLALSPSFQRWSNLSDISNNKFESLPDAVLEMQSLEKLVCNHNIIGFIPDLSPLSTLSHLDLRCESTSTCIMSHFAAAIS